MFSDLWLCLKLVRPPDTLFDIQIVAIARRFYFGSGERTASTPGGRFVLDCGRAPGWWPGRSWWRRDEMSRKGNGGAWVAWSATEGGGLLDIPGSGVGCGSKPRWL